MWSWFFPWFGPRSVAVSARPAPGPEARPDEDGPGGAETRLVVVGFGGCLVVLDNELFVDFCFDGL